jgi:hypothetical protein
MVTEQNRTVTAACSDLFNPIQENAMKKLLLVLALIALMSVSSLSIVGAQDEEEELPPCDSTALMTELEDLISPLEDIEEFMTPAGDSASDFSQLVADLDAYAQEYWANFEEAEFECAEEYFIAYTLGLALDELLIVTELSALSVHEAEAGNEELVATFGELAGARGERLAEDMTAFTEIMSDLMTGDVDTGMDLDECSEEDLTATVDGILEVNEGYIELGEGLEDASGADLSALVAGFATLSSEYWETFVPEVPECQEAQDVARFYGLLLDESLIMVGLIRLAELEAEAGNDELAQTLADSATVRAEALQAMSEELMGEEEE